MPGTCTIHSVRFAHFSRLQTSAIPSFTYFGARMDRICVLLPSIYKKDLRFRFDESSISGLPGKIVGQVSESDLF